MKDLYHSGDFEEANAHGLASLLLAPQMGAEKAKDLAQLLSEGTWTHDFAITYEAAKELGLNVSDEMPVEIL